jgi:O-antigen ligase
MTRAARATLAVTVLAAGLAGILQVLVATRVGLLAAVALPVVAAVAVLVWSRPILGVQLALLAVPLEFFSLRLGGTAGLSPTEALMLLTAAVLVVLWAAGGRPPAVPQPLWAMAAITAAVAISAVVATDTVIVSKIVLMWSAFTIVGVQVAAASPQEIRRILACLAVGGGVAGAIAIAGGTDQTLVAGGVIATNRAQASFAQPNVLAFFLCLAIPVAVALSGHRPSRGRLVALVLAGLATWGLLLTLSRTALIGVFLALGILLLLPRFRRAALVGLAVVVVFSLFNLDAITQSEQVSVVGERLATLGRSGALQHDPRSEIYSTAVRMIGDHPVLGVGAGNFSIVSLRYGLRDQDGLPYDHAHDVVLTFAAELGLPGLLALAWLLLSLIGPFRRALRRRRERHGLLRLGVAASLVAITIPSLGDYPPRTNAIAATFVMLIASLVALDRARD